MSQPGQFRPFQRQAQSNTQFRQSSTLLSTSSSSASRPRTVVSSSQRQRGNVFIDVYAQCQLRPRLIVPCWSTFSNPASRPTNIVPFQSQSGTVVIGTQIRTRPLLPSSHSHASTVFRAPTDTVQAKSSLSTRRQIGNVVGTHLRPRPTLPVSGNSSASRPPTAYIKKRDDSSNFCRSCKKYLAPPPTSRAASVPRAKLFSELTNKELITPLDLDKVVMSDILSIWGYKCYPNDGLSQVICMSCARSIVRTYATQMKLLKNLQNQSVSAEKAEKRVSGMSPSSGASPLTAIEKKRARLAQLQNQGLDGNDQNRLSPKRNIEMDFDRIEMEQEKENVPLDVVPLEKEKQVHQSSSVSQEIKEKISSMMNLESVSVAKIFIGYPSGKVTEYEPSIAAEKKLVRALSQSNPQKAVKAIMEIQSFQPFLRANFSRELQKEAVNYYKSDNCLKFDKNSPSDISNFTLDSFLAELKLKMPITVQFLESMTGIRARRIKQLKKFEKMQKNQKEAKTNSNSELQKSRKEKCNWNTLCNAAAMCLKQYFPEMSKLVYRNTLLLLNGGCRSFDLNRLNMQGLTMSHTSAIRMQYKMAKQFSNTVDEWRNEVKEKEKMVLLMTEVGEKVLSDVNEQSQPVFEDVREVANQCASFSDKTWSKCKDFIEKRHDTELDKLEVSKEFLADELTSIIGSIEDYR